MLFQNLFGFALLIGMNTQAKTPDEGVVEAPKWGELIKAKRLELGETLEQFGTRFGVTKVSVWGWEHEEYEPPSVVTWWLVHGGGQRKK